MFGILVVTHGDMGNGILDAFRMIYGEYRETEKEAIETIGLQKGESPGNLLRKMNDKIQAMLGNGAEGVLVLTDLFGSSTTNAGVNAMLADKSQGNDVSLDGRIAVVSGVNLPMLLELAPATTSYESLHDLARLAVEAGRKNIINAAEEMSRRKKKQR